MPATTPFELPQPLDETGPNHDLSAVPCEEAFYPGQALPVEE